MASKMKCEPSILVGTLHCAGCGRVDEQVLHRVSMSRYRCSDCALRESGAMECDELGRPCPYGCESACMLIEADRKLLSEPHAGMGSER